MQHRAFLAEVGGELIEEIAFSSVRWARKLSRTAEGSVTAPVGALPTELANVEPFAHEVVIYLDQEAVFPSVLIDPEWNDDSTTLRSRDLSEWFAHRTLPFDRIAYEADLAAIFRQYALDGLSQDTSPNIELIATHAGVSGTRDVRAAEYRYAADEMRELARSAVSWTMVGRTMWIGGREVLQDIIGAALAVGVETELPTIRTHNLLSPSLHKRGLATATKQIVKGASGGPAADLTFGGEGSQVVGVAGGISDTYGLLEEVTSELSIRDQFSADAAAQDRWLLSQVPPEYLSTSLVNYSVDPSGMIPGQQVLVQAVIGERTLNQAMRLDALQVTENDDGITVSVDLVPIGSE